MFTAGVGAVIDMPSFSVLVRGLDEWRYHHSYERLAEPRLLAAAKALLGPSVTELRPAPWIPGADEDPNGPAARTGVPVTPFPQWLRCTSCDELGPYHSAVWGFVNDRPRRPDLAHFFHARCARSRAKPLAVPARFLLACTAGHLDDFPYRHFVHRGAACSGAENPRLLMKDFGGNIGANVQIECHTCGEQRNINQAMGARGRAHLPRCRGRHPHLQTFETGGCPDHTHVLVVGASNQWFAQTLSALAVPKTSGSRLDEEVERRWETLRTVHDPSLLPTLRTIGEFAQTAGATGAVLPTSLVPDPHDDDDPDNDELGDNDHDTADEAQDTSAVTAMRRFWDHEVANGRVPTGAELSRAAGVPPNTGLGRRKRREWKAELEHATTTAAG
jgi:hypothetical protein